MTVHELMNDLAKFPPDQTVEIWNDDLANSVGVDGVYEVTVTRGFALPHPVTSKIVVLYP